MEKYYNIKDELQTTLTSILLSQFEESRGFDIELPEPPYHPVYYHSEKIYKTNHYYLVRAFRLINIPEKDNYIKLTVKTPFVFSSLDDEEKEILLNYICDNLQLDLNKYDSEVNISNFVTKCIIHLMDELKKFFKEKLKKWENKILNQETNFEIKM